MSSGVVNVAAITLAVMAFILTIEMKSDNDGYGKDDDDIEDNDNDNPTWATNLSF